MPAKKTPTPKTTKQRTATRAVNENTTERTTARKAAARKAIAKKAAVTKVTVKKAGVKKAAATKSAVNASAAQELPTLPFETPDAFARWLGEHHASSRGLWLELAKAASGHASITYAQAIEVALCWGWIDGLSRRVDDHWYVQKFTPRAPRSLWSKINCAKAVALIEAGKMQPAGLAEVERARQDGRWTRAFDSSTSATVPDDLAAALATHARAAAFFATLDSKNRYAILHRVQTAVKPETRARRIAGFVEMLRRGEKIYP